MTIKRKNKPTGKCHFCGKETRKTLFVPPKLQKKIGFYCGCQGVRAI